MQHEARGIAKPVVRVVWVVFIPQMDYSLYIFNLHGQRIEHRATNGKLMATTL